MPVFPSRSAYRDQHIVSRGVVYPRRGMPPPALAAGASANPSPTSPEPQHLPGKPRLPRYPSGLCDIQTKV